MLIWVLIALAILVVCVMGLGRWMIRKGRDMERNRD
jgi:hypothetical protein